MPAPLPENPPPAPVAPERSTLRVELAPRTIWQAIGAVLLTLVLLWAAAAASSVLAMVAISLFFSLAMEPAVRRLHEHRGWRRGAAVGAIYTAGLGLFVVFVFVLIPAVGLVADAITANSSEWAEAVNDLTSEYLGVPIDPEALAAGSSETGEAVAAWAEEPFGRILEFASSTASLVFNLATIALFTFYLSADAPKLERAVLRRFSPVAQQRISWTWDQAIVQTGGYFYSRSILVGINGLGFFVTLVLVGLPIELALPLAFFAGFVSEFIPAVGTYIGAAVPIAVTLVIQGLVPALAVLGYALVYQQVENYWLSPKISADTMALSGGVAFGAALVGGAIAGPMGAFVSLPVAALLTSTLSNYARSYELVEVEEEPAEPEGPADSTLDDDGVAERSEGRVEA